MLNSSLAGGFLFRQLVAGYSPPGRRSLNGQVKLLVCMYATQCELRAVQSLKSVGLASHSSEGGGVRLRWRWLLCFAAVRQLALITGL